VASVIFMTLMREAVPPERMTSLFSRRSVAMHLALAGGALAFGYWLEYAPFPQGYQAMFLFAFAMAMLSQWHVHQIRPLPTLLAPLPSQKNAIPYGSPWRDPAFLRVAVTVGLSYVAFSAALPVIPLWLVENLGAKEGFVALFSMVELLSAASGAFMAAYFIRRLKHKPHIALAMAGSGLGVLLIAFAPGLWFTLIGAGLMGACWAATDVGLLGLFAVRAPQHDAYSRAYSQLVAGGLFFGPLVTSGLAQSGLGLWWVLVLAALLRALAGAAAVIGKRRLTT
jgi:MFS family permease